MPSKRRSVKQVFVQKEADTSFGGRVRVFDAGKKNGNVKNFTFPFRLRYIGDVIHK